MLRHLRLAAMLLLLLSAPAAAETIAVVAHIHTPVSGGVYSPREIAGMLAAHGIDAGIITDHDRLDIEWGLPLFRNFIGFTYRRSSIATLGAGRYAASIREAAEHFPGLVLIPAIESNPYYRVEIDLRDLRVRVHNLHQHLLAVGLDAPDLVEVPSIANGFRPSPGRRFAAAAAALAVILLFALLVRLLGRERGLRRFRVRSTAPAIVAAVGALVALAALDGLSSRMDRIRPYGPDPGVLPYQIFIDWVDRHGGLTFWSHPGVNETIRWGPVEVVTRPYFDHLGESDRYTGLEDFGRAMVGANGLWDRLLLHHAEGGRQQAPWFLAQADFKSGPPERIATTVNYVEIEERSEHALVESLRAGRFYATQASLGRRWRLEDFHVTDEARSARSGETLVTSAAVSVVARLTRLSRDAGPLWLELVGNGESLARTEVHESAELRFDEAAPRGEKMRYYRLIAGRTPRVDLVANPIFVRAVAAK